jgi:hypothetical protein
MFSMGSNGSSAGSDAAAAHCEVKESYLHMFSIIELDALFKFLPDVLQLNSDT